MTESWIGLQDSECPRVQGSKAGFSRGSATVLMTFCWLRSGSYGCGMLSEVTRLLMLSPALLTGPCGIGSQ